MAPRPTPLPKLTRDDIAPLVFEIGQLFTPSTPIRLADLFAGRRSQINQLLDAVAEPGRHAILYGERGVGKTSLSQILALIVPAGRQNVLHVRKACIASDTFETIWRRFFKELRVHQVGGGRQSRPRCPNSMRVQSSSPTTSCAKWAISLPTISRFS